MLTTSSPSTYFTTSLRLSTKDVSGMRLSRISLCFSSGLVWRCCRSQVSLGAMRNGSAFLLRVVAWRGCWVSSLGLCEATVWEGRRDQLTSDARLQDINGGFASKCCSWLPVTCDMLVWLKVLQSLHTLSKSIPPIYCSRLLLTPMSLWPALTYGRSSLYGLIGDQGYLPCAVDIVRISVACSIPSHHRYK